MIVAIIPARGGSKRIPRKNTKPFAGRPIIAYSIETAWASNLFDRVIVSTDDQEVAETARAIGAEAPFVRPKELADDHVGTDAVIKHAIRWLMEGGEQIEYACCIYATAPFIQAKYLREGYEKLLTSGKAFAFAVTTYPFPIQRALRIAPDGTIEAVDPACAAKRSQDLEKFVHDAGQFYWGRADAYLDELDVYSPAAVPIILPRHLVQDIDTPEDWETAELMYRTMQMFGQVSP